MFGLGSQQAGWSLRRIAVVKSLPESVSLPGRLPKKLFGTGFAELPLRFQCRKVLWCSFRWRLKVFQEQRKIAPLECYQFSCFCWTCSGYCQRAPSRRRSLPGLKGSSIKLFFQIQWSDVIRSGWPIFGLLARLSRLSQPVQLDRDIWRRIRPTGIPVPIDEIQAQLQHAINLELAEAGHSSHILLKSFFSPDSTALWSDISSQGQEYILKEASLKDDQLHSLAYYFLRHLRTEFAGFAGPVDPFLRSILGLSEEQHRSTLSCWDVGAAPVPRNTKGERHKVVEHPEQDVWQICHHHGLATRAFEPSEMGFQRLIASYSTSLQDHGSLAIHRLAVSNITGQAHFNRGGQVTGSLGSRGCGLFAFGLSSYPSCLGLVIVWICTRSSRGYMAQKWGTICECDPKNAHSWGKQFSRR